MEIEEPAANPAETDTANLVQEALSAEQEANTPAEGEGDDLDKLTKEALGESEEANPEFIEVEIDGRKYKIAAGDEQPLDPDLKFGALRDADYRKKTMALSEERKSLEQSRAEYEARRQLEGQAAYQAKNLAALDAEIRELSQIPIQQLRDAGWSEQQIRQAQEELQAKAVERENLARTVDGHIQQLRETEANQFKELREKARATAQLEEKALTPERCDQLEQFATSLGIEEAEARSITDPAAYKILHLADIGKRFIERQRNAANMKAASNGAPAQTLGGKSAGGKSPDDMGPAEMAKHLGY